MRKMLSIAMVALLVSGSAALACGSGCKAKKSDGKKAACSSCTEKKAGKSTCTKCPDKKAEKKCGADCKKACCAK